MKTSGVKVEIFPILGEVTCKARDPFSSSLPGESFSLFCVFFLFLLVLCLFFFSSRKPITSPPSSSLLLVRCSFRFSSPVSSSSHNSEAEAAAKTGDRGSCRGIDGATFFRPFSGHFRRRSCSLKLEEH